MLLLLAMLGSCLACAKYDFCLLIRFDELYGFETSIDFIEQFFVITRQAQI